MKLGEDIRKRLEGRGLDTSKSVVEYKDQKAFCGRWLIASEASVKEALLCKEVKYNLYLQASTNG